MQYKFIKYDPVTGKIIGNYYYSIGMKEEDIECDEITGELTEACKEKEKKRNEDFFNLHYPTRLNVGKEITEEEFEEVDRDELVEIDLVRKKPKKRGGR